MGFNMLNYDLDHFQTPQNMADIRAYVLVHFDMIIGYQTILNHKPVSLRCKMYVINVVSKPTGHKKNVFVMYNISVKSIMTKL